MFKPFVPAGPDWITRLDAKKRQIDLALGNAKSSRTENAVPDGTFSFASEFTVIGKKGNLTVLAYDKHFYVTPSLESQWLLWSFEKGIGDQWSFADQQKMIGAVGKPAIVAKLRNEIDSFISLVKSVPARRQKPEFQESHSSSLTTTAPVESSSAEQEIPPWVMEGFSI
jgi:hypothetical protein